MYRHKASAQTVAPSTVEIPISAQSGLGTSRRAASRSVAHPPPTGPIGSWQRPGQVVTVQIMERIPKFESTLAVDKHDLTYVKSYLTPNV